MSSTQTTPARGANGRFLPRGHQAPAPAPAAPAEPVATHFRLAKGLDSVKADQLAERASDATVTYRPAEPRRTFREGHLVYREMEEFTPATWWESAKGWFGYATAPVSRGRVWLATDGRGGFVRKEN